MMASSAQDTAKRLDEAHELLRKLVFWGEFTEGGPTLLDLLNQARAVVAQVDAEKRPCP